MSLGGKLACFVLALAAFPAVRAEEPVKGRLIEKVVCRNNPAQSYALYVPSNYDPGRAWPVVYAFDPRALGRTPVERFQEAAERLGFIVAGSNNSRNGPPGPQSEAVQAMVPDTEARFNIDTKRRYATGFSGGARLSTQLAYFSNGFAGVMGFGAGFYGSGLPEKVPFVYFGAVGREDFNYAEMRKLDRDMDRLGAAHRIVVFQAAHQWPPKEICGEALEWMDLQAMKTGLRDPDPARVETHLAARLQAAQKLEADGSVYQASLEYASLASDFRGLREVAAWNAKAVELRDSKAGKKGQRTEDDIERRETAMGNEIYRLLEPADAGNAGEARIGRGQRIKDLRKAAEAKEDSPERVAARRALGGLSVRIWEEASVLSFSQKYSEAAARMELAAELDPSRPNTYYSMASYYARAGDGKKAIDRLRTAVSKGFQDFERLRLDPAFEGLRANPQFEKLAAGR